MTSMKPVRPSLNAADTQTPRGRTGEGESDVDSEDDIYSATDKGDSDHGGVHPDGDDDLMDLFGEDLPGEGHGDDDEGHDNGGAPVHAKKIIKTSRRSKRIVKNTEDDPIVCPPCGAGERIPRTLTSPIRPSASDVERHCLTHLPYRPWCPICVKAKGKEDAHFRGAGKGEDEDGDGLPIVSMDYQELNEESEKPQKIIVAKDEVTGNLIAHYVLCKGITDEWVIRKLVKDLEEIGRRDAIVKTDGEPAITAVQSRLQNLREGRTVPRNPPAYNPQSNGPCEKAVQDVAGQLRILKLALEARLGIKIDENLPIMQWALEHAVFVLNKYNVGDDGMVSFERATGRKWIRPIVEFGETVLAKLALQRREKGRTNKQKRKLLPRFIEAVWVGQSGRSGEHIVIKPNGDAVRCRTIKRVPMERRWNAEKVLLTKATPRCPAPSSKSPEKLVSRVLDEQGDQEEDQRLEARVHGERV